MQKCRVILEGNLDLLPGQFTVDLLLHNADFGIAGPDRQVKKQAVAALLPDNHAGLAGSFSIHQNFARIDRQRLGKFAVGDGDALNVHRAVDDQGFSYGHE